MIRFSSPVVRRFWLAMLVVVSLCQIGISQDLVEVKVPSTADQTEQPALMFLPEKTASDQKSLPLLVLLHTWSGDYHQKGHIEVAVEECSSRGWALIHPNFRGANTGPEACGSELAVQDVIDAVDWMIKEHEIDADRVYLTGVSGGGHLSMLMAGRHPEYWAGVSAWVGIWDLANWHQETQTAGLKYSKELESVTGGSPGESEEIDSEYRNRSPKVWLDNAVKVPLDIQAGIHDGHTGSVPISHSISAFNQVASQSGFSDEVVPEALMSHMVREQSVPATELFRGMQEPRSHGILFRRTAGPTRLTIFEGGHEGDVPTAIRWLESQGPRSPVRKERAE
ncbi:prolyl oligopeptidase family serine peptidase [Thalassoglobus sp. JC818]|uniref:alpha/beta hydrolase family protein n=1 Tax=Thalassoglobus sp. JC818 TaxID=3232136 RepID=UPI00345775E8